ncbi:zinc finger CCCH domain-containing protein 32-like isoform X1 [Typha latifolia]|uniref:zinc finger CCCH domain-containing protein 32-like isoform X1 n=1 Tax=Typha latifolia TaxID=4733 RepID=UPI003C2D1DB4
METGGGQEEIRPLTAEEEAQKRNTDCVYFLASPLTCKKGSECEYRHSEGARVNPRDCWYWLNGNCLNPKCSFRHPPLDGLFGVPTTSGPVPPPPSHTSLSPQVPASVVPAYNTSKQIVPCYYFQKGNCLKGDKCPFMHGTQAAGNPISHQVPKVSTSFVEPPMTQKKDLWGIKECRQQHILTQQNNHIIGADKPKASVDKPTACVAKPRVTVDKPIEATPTSAKSFTKAASAPKDIQLLKKSLPTNSSDDDHRFHQSHLPVASGYVQNMDQYYEVQPSDGRALNGKESDEFLRESSPGFDVLVDNDDDDTGYLHNEDEYARALQDGRNLNPGDDYEYYHDHELVHKYERDQYNELAEYDQLGQPHDSYEREQRKTSPERVLDGSSLSKRRVSQRGINHHEIDSSDLRHRLKQRRLDGSRSDGRAERYRRDGHYLEERQRGHHTRRDQQHVSRVSSISTRLKGRIRLPGRSSPDKVDLQTEKEGDRGRPHGRLSPVRSLDFPRRHGERVRQRSSEEFAAGARSLGGKLTKGDDIESLNFAGPKRLAELKGTKSTESSREQSTKSMGFTSMDLGLKNSTKAGESEGSLPFDGPMPLSVILKRKREATSGNRTFSSIGGGSERYAEDVVGSSVLVSASEVESMPPVEAAEKGNEDNASRLEGHTVEITDDEEEEGLIHAEGEAINYNDQSSSKEDMIETTDAVNMDNVEDQEMEHYDQRAGESDYDTIEDGDYRTEEEHAYQDDEDEFDEEDDFTRKVGVMFS